MCSTAPIRYLKTYKKNVSSEFLCLNLCFDYSTTADELPNHGRYFQGLDSSGCMGML